MKVKKLVLSYHKVGTQEAYIVERVEHTTEYNPGDSLHKKEVDQLNANRYWHVTIVKAKS